MTESRNFLLRTASAARRRDISLAPANCTYDPVIGAWVLKDTTRLLVETDRRSVPGTKKNDIETGEDQKGE